MSTTRPAFDSPRDAFTAIYALFDRHTRNSFASPIASQVNVTVTQVIFVSPEPLQPVAVASPLAASSVAYVDHVKAALARLPMQFRSS